MRDLFTSHNEHLSEVNSNGADYVSLLAGDTSGRNSCRHMMMSRKQAGGHAHTHANKHADTGT